MLELEQVVQEEVQRAREVGGSLDEGVIFRRVMARLKLAITGAEADKVAALLKSMGLRRD